MINIPTKLLKDVQEGILTQKDIEKYLIENHTISDIIAAFAELLIVSDGYVNKPKITVSEEEFAQITSLFKIRGLRTLDGMVISETRGRPSKHKTYKAE